MLRRELLRSCAASAAWLATPAFSQSSIVDESNDIEILGSLPPLPDDLLDFASQSPAQYVQFNPTGIGNPRKQEQEKAFSILTSSPWGQGSAIEVADYFLALNANSAQYRREWPERANPVIFHFFTATSTIPSGDVTPWCAAFVNWCFARSRAKSEDEIGTSPGNFSYSGKPFGADSLANLPTGSASSGSFRCLTSIEVPQSGDLVVLANKGTRGLQCRGSGHVTFFSERVDGNRVKCVGGNQTQTGSNGAITECLINTNSTRFFSFVRV